MTYTVAFSGKGGTGKTTLAALTVDHFRAASGQAPLAVDADPNATLGAALGVEVENTIGDIREDMVAKRLQLSEGMSKENMIELMIEQSIVEADGFDLLTMGRPEGPGCYCYVNSLLRRYLQRCHQHYGVVVVDNEAGMEHLSRRTTDGVDLLVVVAEPTAVSLHSARRVIELSEQLPITIGRRLLIINKSPGPELSAKLDALAAELDLEPGVIIPYDPEVAELAADGRPVTELSKDNPTRRALVDALDEAALKA